MSPQAFHSSDQCDGPIDLDVSPVDSFQTRLFADVSA